MRWIIWNGRSVLKIKGSRLKNKRLIKAISALESLNQKWLNIFTQTVNSFLDKDIDCEIKYNNWENVQSESFKGAHKQKIIT